MEIITFLKKVRTEGSIEKNMLKNTFQLTDGIFDKIVKWGLKKSYLLDDFHYILPSNTLELLFKNGLEDKIKEDFEKEFDGFKTWSFVTPLPDNYVLTESDLKENEVMWLRIPVQEVRIYPGSNPIYEIKIYDKILKLEEEDLLNPNNFRTEYFKFFGVMLSPLSQSKWSRLLTMWRFSKGIILKEKEETISEEEQILEEIINYINNSHIIDKKEYTFREGYVFLDGENILVPSDILKRVVERLKIKFSLRKLSYILKDYLISGSIRSKIGKDVKRFWAFDLSKFELDTKKVVTFEEEEL